MILLQLESQEVTALKELIHRALQQGGLQVAEAAVFINRKLDDAVAQARKSSQVEDKQAGEG